MNEQDQWPRRPEAAQFYAKLFSDFAVKNPTIAAMAERFRTGAGVDILALVDHWILPPQLALETELPALGFIAETNAEGDEFYSVPGTRLPLVRIKANRETPTLALRVENLDDFATANGLTYNSVHGDFDSRYQCAHVALQQGELMPIVRRGYAGFAPGSLTDYQRRNLNSVRAAFRGRPRELDDALTMTAAYSLVPNAVKTLGAGRATDEFFASERDYYLTRNFAARYQYERQQEIGVGWANHDHHTYRSSRAAFQPLITLWQRFGFAARERFYAGAEAGWGAQILEHPESRVILFCDVDVSPEELDIDFANVSLEARDLLGTIGLWCALHGDSIGTAGLHHLECEFDFAAAETLLTAAGIGVMKPFTDFPMLKQAFTQPELWTVSHDRLAPLIACGAITPEQAERFASVGAAGSHLEILQRWEGFKGFNKTGVSAIIRETDARNEISGETK